MFSESLIFSILKPIYIGLSVFIGLSVLRKKPIKTDTDISVSRKNPIKYRCLSVFVKNVKIDFLGWNKKYLYSNRST